jgi:hypothetical protein
MFPKDQLDELKEIAPDLSAAEEGGITYILIKDLKMPANCNPSIVDALLCPTARDGYSSRLFFSQKITGCPERNWNGQIRLLDKTWYAISWQTKPGASLKDMLINHLNPFRNVE